MSISTPTPMVSAKCSRRWENPAAARHRTPRRFRGSSPFPFAPASTPTPSWSSSAAFAARSDLARGRNDPLLRRRHRPRPRKSDRRAARRFGPSARSRSPALIWALPAMPRMRRHHGKRGRLRGMQNVRVFEVRMSRLFFRGRALLRAPPPGCTSLQPFPTPTKTLPQLSSSACFDSSAQDRRRGQCFRNAFAVERRQGGVNNFQTKNPGNKKKGCLAVFNRSSPSGPCP